MAHALYSIRGSIAVQSLAPSLPFTARSLAQAAEIVSDCSADTELSQFARFSARCAGMTPSGDRCVGACTRSREIVAIGGAGARVGAKEYASDALRTVAVPPVESEWLRACGYAILG